jgi:small-conductance mechanosensitive channel
VIALAVMQMPTVDIEQLSEVGSIIRWTGVLISAFVIVGAILLLKLEERLIKNLSESVPHWRMVLLKARALINFSVYLGTAAIVVLLSFHLSKPVLAFLGGTAAVAVGFAFKDLVASLVGGITIMIDRPFQVGDRVSFGGYYGDITSIGLRSVRLQTLDDNTVTVPNSMFVSDATSCGNYGALDMMVVVTFHVAVGQDVRRARELVREVAVTSRYVFLAKPIGVNVEQVRLEGCVAARLTLKAYVFDLQYERELVTDITLRVLEVFSEEGIQPPAVTHRSAERGLGDNSALERG